MGVQHFFAKNYIGFYMKAFSTNYQTFFEKFQKFKSNLINVIILVKFSDTYKFNRVNFLGN